MREEGVFKSRLLRPGDLQGQTPVATIDRVATEVLGGDERAVLYFVGKAKALPLNRTNWRAIEALTGEPDSDNWPGHRVRLTVARVEFKGGLVDAIRVQPVTPAAPALRPVRRAPAVTPPASEIFEDGSGQLDENDDIPF